MLRKYQSDFLRYAIVSLLCIFGHTRDVRGQNPGAPAPDDTWHFQFDLFQLLLEEQELRLLPDLDEALSAPRESVIVMADPKRGDAIRWNEIGRFVQAGGAVLVASDRALTMPGIGRFMFGTVTTTDVNSRYGLFADCVLVSDITNVDAMFRGVLTIITNRSTWFLPERRGTLVWETVARFPQESLPRTSQEKPLLALARPADGGSGIIVVSADASLLTNGMLWHGDNAVLAIRLSKLLTATGKSRLMFMAGGQVLGKVSDRLPTKPDASERDVDLPQRLPEPQLSQLLKLGNAVAKEVIDSNVLNEALKQRPRNWQPAKYFRVMLIAMMAALVLWALWILLMGRPLRSLLLRRRRMRSAYEMRIATGTDSSDYRQSAGYLARELCWELTGSRHSADWQKYAASLFSAEPAVSRTEQSELVKIIDIASRGCREPMTGFDFQQLGKTIASLRAKQSKLKASAHPSRVQ